MSLSKSWDWPILDLKREVDAVTSNERKLRVTLSCLNSTGTGLCKCAETTGSKKWSLGVESFLEVQCKWSIVEVGTLSIFNRFVMQKLDPPRHKRERRGRWIV
jgi:hypothetical protein